jgi:hypothetical protein
VNDEKSRATVIHKGRTWIYKCERDDDDAELEFELDFQASLTTAERFQMMLDRSEEIRMMLHRNGNIETPQIVKRT